ncbi:MAG: hypothetical protein HYT94_03775 [Parcubacteria group bacterium]|nr:hypothetical protein [Parcubacteria group bacterium]
MSDSKNQRAKEKIIRERIQLLLHYPFFGYLALGLEPTEAPGLGTMATDGKHLFYDPLFADRLEPKILRTVLAHETLHCALGHIWRKEGREDEKWNYAADHADNLILKKEGFAIPSNCLCDEKFTGMEAEIIYTKLPNAPPKNGRLMDSHDKWSRGKKPENSFGGEAGEKADKKLEKEWRERMVRAATSARNMGKLSGTIDQCVQDILQPKLDWRIILRDMITSCAKNDFRLFPSSKKHLWRNMYLPSISGETLEIAVGIDTSGSISAKEFQEFIAEIRGIAEQFDSHTLHLFFCDAKIHERMTLTAHDDWPEEFPKRNGGTNFIPVFNAIEEECLSISALVYLTDGDGKYPEYSPDYPVMWVLNNDYEVPWGQKIIMEEE